jgi:hypothetical protein
MSGEDLSKLTGLSHNFKRKMQRDIQKYQAFSASGFATDPPSAVTAEGSNNTRSKKMEPVEVTAYAMFNAVIPTYNLDYLAKIYEMNASHYAAVQAKIANVIGLGYDFLETPAVLAKYDEIPDDIKQLLS